MGHKSSLTFIPQMNDKETHVVMDIREHCKEQMANEHVRDWGARRKTWSDAENFQQLKETTPESEQLWKYGWSSLAQHSLVLGHLVVFCNFPWAVPSSQMLLQMHPTWYISKHPHRNQPTTTTTEISYPQAMNGSVISNQSCIWLNSRFGTSYNKSWPGGLCCNNHPFSFLCNIDLWQEVERRAKIPVLMKS